jgi:hypothetical protein
MGMTNASGEFQIKNVPAGNYFVMVDAAGIITPLSLVDLAEVENEKLAVEEIKKQFDEIVVDGTNDVTVKVRARRGGSISGKVTYADGDPAINVRVNVMRKKDGQLRSFITNLNPSTFFGIQTDDRGMYRVAGLPPGEYIVSASETIDHTGDGGNQRGEDLMFGSASLVVTYYPGATKQTSATAIQVDAGQEQKEINITLVERPLRTLSGTVVARRDNTPLSAQVTITGKENAPAASPFSAMTTTVSTDEQGRFTFNEIPDGVYTLTVEPSYSSAEVDMETQGDGQTASPAASPPDPAQQAAPTKLKYTRKVQDVTVSGGDLTDVVIALTEGASISGTVTVEGGRPLPEETIVKLEALNEESMTDAQQTVQRDGTFTITGVPPGTFYPNVFVPQDENYYVKTVTMGGADLLREPLSVNDNSNITDVQVVISHDGATLAGRILNANNTPALNRQLVLIPTEQSRWHARLSFLFVTSEADGGYSVSGAPGEYFIIFMRAGEDLSTINDAWIRVRAANAQRVTLLPGEHKMLTLTAPAQ